MLPCPVLIQESISFGMDGGIHPIVKPAVFAHRADLDADSTGRDALPVQLIAMLSAGLLVGQSSRIVLLIQSVCRAHLHASHASGAELTFLERIRLQLG